jgi:hypothetical protein
MKMILCFIISVLFQKLRKANTLLRDVINNCDKMLQQNETSDLF